jgi:hypothetical protein
MRFIFLFALVVGCAAEGVDTGKLDAEQGKVGGPQRGAGDSRIDAGEPEDVGSGDMKAVYDVFLEADLKLKPDLVPPAGDVSSPQSDLKLQADLVSQAGDVSSPQPDLKLSPDLAPATKPLGASCTTDNQCEGNHCVTGTCCATVCEGGCTIGCGADGQCKSCNTCTCSGMTGQCHC